MDVLALQTRLKSLGFDPCALDGQCGPATTAAIERFQAARGLKADGIVGMLTLSALFPEALPASSAPAETLAAGEPAWIAIGRKFLGLHEAPGTADNPLIARMYADAGSPGVVHDSVPWCAAFVSAMIERAGVRSARTLWAPSYAQYGQKLDAPIYGCIGVKLRHGGGHVTFIVGANGDRVFGLGGNQGDAVSVAAFAKDDFIAWRWPQGVALPATPHPLPASYAGALSGVSEA